jgi:hypothetical protein
LNRIAATIYTGANRLILVFDLVPGVGYRVQAGRGSYHVDSRRLRRRADADHTVHRRCAEAGGVRFMMRLLVGSLSALAFDLAGMLLVSRCCR